MNRFRRQQRIVLVGTMLLAGGAVFGQEPAKRNNIFGTLAFVGGSHLGGRAALDFKTKKDWSIGLVYGFFTGRARDLPEDYSQHYVSGPLGGGPKTLKDVGQYGAITIGRNTPISRNIAWHNRIGLSVNSIRLHENFRLDSGPEPGLFSHGSSTLYGYNQVYHFPLGLYAGSSLEFVSDSWLGGTVGFSANLNGVRSSLGFDLGILIGKRGLKSLGRFQK